MRNLKKMMGVAVLMLVCGCVKNTAPEGAADNAVNESGSIVVSVKNEMLPVRSLAEYQSAKSCESAVYNVDVLVFDSVSKRLERSATTSSLEEKCSFELSAGEKLVYAVVNGPDMSRVRSLDQMMALAEDLSSRDYLLEGFVMIGYEHCVVSSGTVCKPEIIVKRLVSRVELRSIKCNVPRQYESMKVECVYLGNAYSVQSLSGAVSVEVNGGGYADKDKQQPIGLGGVKGACDMFMYREPGAVIKVGEVLSDPIYMYCQPDAGKAMTCLYILAQIGDGKYYYRVPLNKGLLSNTTCVVDVVITNLGAHRPPDGDMQKGEIQAVVKVMDWLTGDEYHAEF